MFEFALVIFAVLFFFLVNALYALFVVPAIQQRAFNLVFGDNEAEDWTADHVDSALNLDKNN